jgi:hypothetical protein
MTAAPLAAMPPPLMKPALSPQESAVIQPSMRRPPFRLRLAALLLAVSALLPAGAAADDGLGRLFFTPEKREQLDRQRARNALDAVARDESPQIVINGQVRRSSGRHTTWINGQPQASGDAASGVAARPDPRVPGRAVVKAGDTPQVSVKIGNTLNRGTQESQEVIGDGTIATHPPRSSNGR